MADTRWTFDAEDGELLIHTGVTGRAAKMGHRLTIAMRRWQAVADWDGGQPVAVELTVEVDSLEVLRGEGGVKALSGAEKVVARSNALRSLDAGRHPTIGFTADDIAQTDDGYRLTGTLQIHGKSRDQVVDVQVDESGDLWTASSSIRQTDFGVRPFALLMGSVKVADEVTVTLRAHRSGES